MFETVRKYINTDLLVFKKCMCSEFLFHKCRHCQAQDILNQLDAEEKRFSRLRCKADNSELYRLDRDMLLDDHRVLQDKLKLTEAERDGASSLLLDVQKECAEANEKLSKAMCCLQEEGSFTPECDTLREKVKELEAEQSRLLAENESLLRAIYNHEGG